MGTEISAEPAKAQCQVNLSQLIKANGDLSIVFNLSDPQLLFYAKRVQKVTTKY